MLRVRRDNGSRITLIVQMMADLKTTTNYGLTITREDKLNYYRAMSFPGQKGKIIEGEPLNGRLVEKIIFTGGLSADLKVKFLQIKYSFPNGFKYKQLMKRFEISKRTAYRWVARMKQLGIVDYVNVGDQNTMYAKYKIKDNWK